MHFGYIGIDFGTSNTHIAYCNCEGELVPQAVPLNNKPAQTTCVLWKVPKGQARQDPELIQDFGSEALQGWLDAQLDGEGAAGARPHFAFGFKPDLAVSEAARLDAWAFLHKACVEVKKAGLPRTIAPEGYAVVVGVPAEVGEAHRKVTAEVAERAGFGKVECVEEPLGALAYHLRFRDVTPEEARAGVVVVDFGGGTLDVARVSADGLHEPWGDPTLGGRLFDDLFYQWVSDQNPSLEVPEHEALVVWQHDCRELKERFSARWKQKGDGLADFKGSIMVGGAHKFLRNASVREFETRARSYRPSLMVRRYFQGLDRVPTGLVLNEPIDLFARIGNVLTNGGRASLLRGKYGKVILTGGSSHWPFMRRLVAEAFGVDEEKGIVMSQTPETTIGSGLAMFNVLKARNAERAAEIAGKKPQAMEGFTQAVTARLDRYAEELSEALLGAMMPRAEKELWDWYRNGGSLNQAEARVNQAFEQFKEKEAPEIMKRYWGPLNADLVRMMREHLGKFLRENEIDRDAAYYIPESVTLIQDLHGGAHEAGGRIAGDLGNLAGIASAVAVVIVIIIAAVKVKVIGAVMLAAMSVPPLAVALGIGALIAMGVAREAVKEQVEGAIKAHEFNSVTLPLLKLFIWESTFQGKLTEARADARAKLLEAIRKHTREAREAPGEESKKPLERETVELFERYIDTVTKNLGVMEQIRRGR